MREAHAVVNRQTPCYLPTIHSKEFSSVIAFVVQVAEVCFLVLSGKARQQVRIGIAAAAACPASFRDQAVRVSTVGLVVDDEFVEKAKLRCMRAPDLRHVVADGGQMLLCKKATAAAGFKTARIEHGGKFTTPSGQGGYLVHAIVKESRKRNIQGLSAHFVGISEHIREINVGVAKDEFIRQGRIEHVGQAG